MSVTKKRSLLTLDLSSILQNFFLIADRNVLPLASFCRLIEIFRVMPNGALSALLTNNRLALTDKFTLSSLTEGNVMKGV